MISASSFFWANERGLQFDNPERLKDKPDLVFYFFDKKISNNMNVFEIVRARFPESIILGCSSSGPILNDDIYLDTFTGLAVSFDKTKVKFAQGECLAQENSFEAGKKLVEQLLADDLAHIFTITDGMTVHGTHFLNGANSVLPEGVSITGGMSSDGFEFKETLTGINQPPKSGQVCAIGFYGDSISVSCGAEGGWDKFGLERVVTKSSGNILYELDGLPALDLYKEYLGADADKLPGSGLLFPLSVRKDDKSDIIVRTIDVVDEKTKAVRFSGDIPQGYIAQFMKGNFRNLVKGAETAARHASEKTVDQNGIALVVSCLGRQLLMGQQVSDELEAIKSVLGEDMPAVGFYSNGEYSSQGKNEFCVLHNQTMTLTIIQET